MSTTPLWTSSWTIRFLLVPAAILATAAAPARAPGQRPAGDSALAARNEALLQAAARRDARGAARFFPRRGTWDWVRASPKRGGETLIRRFAAAETARVIGLGGPACELFDGPRGSVGPLSDASLAIQANMYGARWRRVGATRFVSPETDETPPVFVEWRREGQTWVVSRIGVRRHYTPPSPGPERNLVTPNGSGGEFATAQRWFTRQEAIEFRSARYGPYGLARPLAAAEVTRVGALDGVGVYAEAGARGVPDVLYVMVGPDRYQPYTMFAPPTCHHLTPADATP
ncbi:MAG TPA: hypothetical protein VHG28_23970 [Longimicrobiaceae bacterium]|nr:hypothetical protein [Longimicrobiaceae bacterium]